MCIGLNLQYDDAHTLFRYIFLSFIFFLHLWAFVCQSNRIQMYVYNLNKQTHINFIQIFAQSFKYFWEREWERIAKKKKSAKTNWRISIPLDYLVQVVICVCAIFMGISAKLLRYFPKNIKWNTYFVRLIFRAHRN